MTTELLDGVVSPSLRGLLSAAGWRSEQNNCIDDIIERFDDCPEGLRDFDHSDWVNQCECYTYQLIQRWEQQREAVRALFDDYCEAIGATSTLEALEGQTIEDPEDMAAAMVNAAMTWGARCLADAIWPDR
jgi:hypothetical protein